MLPTRYRRLLAAVVAAYAGCACALPAHASAAAIVLDKTIVGIRPGMTASQVKHRLGRPSAVYRSRGTVPYDSWEYRRGHRPDRVYVLFLRHGKKLKPADTVGTLNPAVRTSNGIHVGITRAKLKHRVKGLVCSGAFCFTHNPSTYDGVVTRFLLSRERGRSVVGKLELFRSTPPKPKAAPAPSPPRPASEGGPNVPTDFTSSCPCWPHDPVSFEVTPPAHENPSYAEVATYRWDFGDGGSATGWYQPNASHTYQDPGTYTVTLTMVDEDGASWFIAKQVVVRAPRPAADSPNPSMPKEFTIDCAGDGGCSVGSLIVFALTLPPADIDHPYPTPQSWDFGDGATAEGAFTSDHIYSQPGTYTVTATMIDDGDQWFVSRQVQISG